MTDDDTHPVWLSPAQAAERLSVDIRSVRRLIDAGTLPAFRLGKRLIRLRPEDVDAALTRIQAGQ